MTVDAKKFCRRPNVVAAPEEVVLGGVCPCGVVGAVSEERGVEREVGVDPEVVRQGLLGTKFVVASGESEESPAFARGLRPREGEDRGGGTVGCGDKS
jgi:hypothetical protein